MDNIIIISLSTIYTDIAISALNHVRKFISPIIMKCVVKLIIIAHHFQHNCSYKSNWLFLALCKYTGRSFVSGMYTVIYIRDDKFYNNNYPFPATAHVCIMHVSMIVHLVVMLSTLMSHAQGVSFIHLLKSFCSEEVGHL